MKRKGLEGHLLAAQTVGLVGSGYVAQRHIRLLRAFGPRIRVADPFLTEERAQELGVERASMEQVFGECTVIAVHVPKTPETHHLIGADLLRRIQPGAVLIQTSRILGDGPGSASVRTGDRAVLGRYRRLRPGTTTGG